MSIYTSHKTEQLTAALREYGYYPYRDDSNYPLPRAQRALSGRTHYVDDATLRYFKARILRCTVSHHGFYLLLQESLAHPDLGRVRRNVVFDVFGTAVIRDKFHKYAKQADKEFSEMCAYIDSEVSADCLKDTFCKRVERDAKRLQVTTRLLADF